MLEILGQLKNINFSFETNGKLMALGVPILKHFRVHEMVRDNALQDNWARARCMGLQIIDSFSSKQEHMAFFRL